MNLVGCCRCGNICMTWLNDQRSIITSRRDFDVLWCILFKDQRNTLRNLFITSKYFWKKPFLKSISYRFRRILRCTSIYWMHSECVCRKETQNLGWNTQGTKDIADTMLVIPHEIEYDDSMMIQSFNQKAINTNTKCRISWSETYS